MTLNFQCRASPGLPFHVTPGLHKATVPGAEWTFGSCRPDNLASVALDPEGPERDERDHSSGLPKWPRPSPGILGSRLRAPDCQSDDGFCERCGISDYNLLISNLEKRQGGKASVGTRQHRKSLSYLVTLAAPSRFGRRWPGVFVHYIVSWYSQERRTSKGSNIYMPRFPPRPPRPWPS